MFFGGNVLFVEELYENYFDNFIVVFVEWCDYFDCLVQMFGFVVCDVVYVLVIVVFVELVKDGGFCLVVVVVGGGDIKKQFVVGQLVMVYCFMGICWVEFDLFKCLLCLKIDEFELLFYGFFDLDLNQFFNVGFLKGLLEIVKFGDIFEILKQIYCSFVGVEYMYMFDYNEKCWLQECFEGSRLCLNYGLEQKKCILEWLIVVEMLECYLYIKYVGQKCFFLEGGDLLIVVMDEMICIGG